MEPKVTAILKELEGARILTSSICEIKEHRGGTDTILLEITDTDKDVAVKIEKPELVKQVVSFLGAYRDITLFPNLLYVSKDFSFFVYPFIKGEKSKRALTEQELESIVENVINHYQVSETNYWGEQMYSSTTILEYINSLLVDQKEKIAEVLGQDEYQKVFELTQSLFAAFDEKPYLTHGDLGSHNIIIENNTISGIIDPLIENSLPVIELAFLLCSMVHDYGVDTIKELFSKLKTPSGFNKQDFLKIYRIMLYIRIGRCLKYNPRDIETYLKIYRNLL
ncbi:MAG: hypothetical protein WC629_02760 [Candidatus Paceibacterota bacterium]|jgi:hypothetical protein